MNLKINPSEKKMNLTPLKFMKIEVFGIDKNKVNTLPMFEILKVNYIKNLIRKTF